MKYILQFLGCIFAGFLGAIIFYYISTNYKPLLINHFYAVESAVHVSPHGLRKQIDKGDTGFVLVDLRSKQEYLQDHIIGSVSIPAYKDPDTSAYDDKDRILGAFKNITIQYPDKDIIVYCYSGPCMTGRKIGYFLAKNGIYVKHLGIGWNEWKYHRTLRNHEHEREKTDYENYIGTGADIDAVSGSSTCPIDNEFGC